MEGHGAKELLMGTCRFHGKVMNRIYKVIFNRSLGLYQVVSEIARNHGKSSSPAGRGRKSLLVPFVLSALLGLGLTESALAEDTGTTVANAAVTVKDGDQMVGSGAASVSSSSTKDETSGKTTTTITVAVPTNGEVAENNTGLVTGGTVYTAVNKEQTARTEADTDLSNRIGTLNAEVKTNADAINKEKTDREAAVTNVTNTVSTLSDSAVKYDTDPNKGKVTLAGEGGTTITNVKDGAVSGSSTDAVTGKQLYNVSNRIGTLDANGNYIQKDASVSSNLSTLDTQVKANADTVSTLSDSAVKYDTDSNKGKVTLAGEGGTTITNVKDGAVSGSSTDAVTGKQLYNVSNRIGTLDANGNYIQKDGSVSSNLSTLDNTLKNFADQLGVDLSSNTNLANQLYKYYKVNPEITTNADATKTYAPDAAANGKNSVAIGPSTQAGDKSTDATTSTTTVTGGTSSTAIGDSAKANGDQSVALGYGSEVLNASGSTTAVSGSTAIGNGAKVEGGSDSTALGSGATVDTASGAMALGKGATINKTAASGVAIGNGAVTGSADKTITVNNLSYAVKAAGGENSVAIGTDASSAGNTSLALGKGATVENDSDGSYQAVVNSDDIAVGTGAKTTASNASTAIGKGASVAQSTDALAIGSLAAVGASATNAMALGQSATVGSGAADSIAMGTKAKTISADTIAIGQNTSAEGANSVAIGKGAATTNEGGNAIGTGSAASGSSTAIGQSAQAINYNALAIGNNATANADKSISLGYNAGVGTSEGKGETQNAGSLIAIGTSAGNNVSGMQNVAIGESAGSNVKSSNNIAIGTSAGNNVSGMQNVAIGESAGSNVKSSNNIAIGTQAGYGINYASDNKVQNGYNVSIGYKANYQENAANIMYATALGNEANASNYAVAIGDGAKASGTNSLALGYSAQASDAESMALGHNASAADGNVAIGNGSLAPSVSTLGTVKAVTVDGKTINYVYDANGNPFKSAFTYKPLQADSHYISVGNSTLTRRISNVADGVFASDAATVGQLNSLNELLQATDTKVGLTRAYFDDKFTALNTTVDASKTHYFSISESSDNLSANKDNTGATSNKADAMAIGPNANATNVKSLAVGNNVYATGLRSIAIGTAPNPTKDAAGTTTTHNTSAEGENSIALGTSTTAQADNSIAIGTRAQTYTTDTTSKTGAGSVAIGNLATTAGNQSVALGYDATVKYDYGTAIGSEALASGTDAVAVGKGSKAYSTDSTAIGQNNTVTGSNVYGLGSSNAVSGNWGSIVQSGVSGYKNTVTSVSDQDTTNALTGVYMTGSSNTLNQDVKYNVMQDITVQGSSNTIDGGAGGTSGHPNTLSQIAIVGSGNTVQGKSSDDSKTNNIKDVTILGYNNKVDANTDTTVDFSNTQILGSNVTAKLGNSVYLGSNAAYTGQTLAANDAITSARTAADAAAEASDAYKAATTDAEKAQIKAQYEAQYLYKLNVQAMEASGTTAGTQSYSTDETYGDGTSYTYAGSSPAGVVTVGSVGAERRIQNVAAGLVSATSTDAVNGSQLYALTRQIRFGGDNSSFGKTTAADDQNVVARGSNETISITGGSDAVTPSTTDGNTTYTVDTTKLTDNNIAVVADTDKAALHVQLASSLKNLNTAQLGSGSGDSYKETVKLDGTDTTNGGTLALKDASGANGVTLRTSGTAKTADVTGTETSRLLVNDKTVATTDDGLKFGGDTGTDSALKLNNKLTVKGGATTGLSDNNNIGVVSDGSNGTLTVKLNKDVNLGTDGSLTTGTVTATTVNATTVKTGDSTLTTSGLSIANGPSVLTSGINAGNKKITSVTAGETDTDAANYGQVKAAKTTLTAQGSNVTITPDTTSDDKHTNYTVSVSNLSYKAGTDMTAKNVTLSNGLTFQNGKNTTAVAGDNGTITYNLNDKIELGAETDSNNHIVVDGAQGLLTLGMDATINGNAGIASIGGVSIGKSGSDQVITGLTNKTWTVGTTQAVDGRAATENQLQSVADNLNTANTNIATLQHGFKVQANGDTTTESTVKADDALNFTAGDNTNVTTTKDSKQITISVDNLSVKDNNGTAQSVKLADGLNFQDGTNTMAVVGTNGSVTYDLKSSITLGTSTDEANRIIVNGTNGTITVGNLATINGNAGMASIGGVSIGKSGSDQTVTGLSNRTWVVGESTAVNGRAATEDQLQSVSNAAYTNANNITMLQQGFTVTANNDNDKKSTIKAGDKLNFQAGKNVQVSTTADSKSIEVALSDMPEFTTVTAKDASGNVTTVSGTGVTIAPTGTRTPSVSLTSEGLDNGNHVIKNVASGGTERTNAANIGDLQDAISNASTTATNTGFKVKGDDATSQTVKLGKQLNVVGGTTDSTQLSTGNIGVETTADAEGNATLTVKLKKDIALDSVTTGSTTMNTTGISNGDMSLTNTGMIIKNNDVSKQVSVTTSGVSMGSQQVKNVADGTDAKDAVNKGQLDAVQTQVTNGWQIAGSNGQKVADIGAGKKVTFGDTMYATASVQPDGTDGAKVTYTINTAEITNNAKTGVVTAPTTDGVATAQNVAQAINNAAWKIKANDNEATAIKAGTTVGLKAGNNLTLSQSGTDFTYSLKPEISLTKVMTGSSTLDTNGLTITGGPSVTTSGIDAGSKKITGVANGENASDAVNKGQLDALQTQVNSASFNVKADNSSGAVQAVKAGDTVTFANDSNLTLVQGEKTFTYGLNKEINISKVTTSDPTKGSTVQTAEGVTTTDAAGNTYIQNGQGITLTPSDKTKSPVKLTNTGLDNGGNKITGVGKGTDDTDAVNVAQLKEVNDKVGSGWQLADNDGTRVADIGAGKKVSFKTDSQYLTAKTESAGTDAANVTYGLKTKALEVADGKVSSVDTAEDGLATAKNVADTINQTYWTAASGKSGSGSQTDETANDADKQISAGDTVTFNAGNNLSLAQNGASFTYGLQADLTGMNTITFTPRNDAEGHPISLVIGKQKDGVGTDEGYYITGLDNTTWNQSNYVKDRAATEAQLADAIKQVTLASQSGGFKLSDDNDKEVSQVLGKAIGVVGDGNITTTAETTTADPNGHIKVSLKKNIDLGTDGSLQAGGVTLKNNSVTVGNNGIVISSTDSEKTVSNLSNTTWDTAKVNQEASAGGYKGSTKAATESQLAEAISTATSTASANEQHIKDGSYSVTTIDNGDGTKSQGVSIDIITGDGSKPEAVKGHVVIKDVAKASEVGTVSEIADDLKKKNGDTVQPTSVVEAINNLNDKVGDKNYSKVQGEEITDGDNTTTAIGKLNNRMNDIYQTAGQHTIVSNTDKNLEIKPTTDDKGKTNYEINLSKQVNLGNVQLDGDKGSIEAKSMKADSFTAGSIVVDKDGVKVGGNTYIDNNGLNANGNAIHNVGEGKEDNDAVNVKQVNELAARQGAAITENAAHISQLGRAVNKLDNRINRVGAGAAALAALHPGSYDPDDKLDVSAGVGNYRGANAAAVGLFFHPNERTILSVAGSMGGGENMVNAGVTLKVGPGHGTPTTVTTRTGQKVDVMDILAKQTEILEKLAGNAKAVSAPAGSDIFPDVPQNHWAYAYVDKLYRTGSLAGFSEPGKLKSHMLTRKDFAEILYWAMTNGATTNPDLNSDGSLNRLAAEFGAELKLVMR